MTKQLKFIDLFCGLGSFHLALQKYGKCVLACDIDEKIKEVYKKNFGMDVFHDVTQIKKDTIKSKVDIVCAGSPCQSFSKAGYKMGIEDSRGLLFFETLRIAKMTNCKYIIQENVKGLLNLDNGKVIQSILDRIRKIGYISIVIQASPHELTDIPQHRDRIFIFSIRQNLWNQQSVNRFLTHIQSIKETTKDYKPIILPKSKVTELKDLQLQPNMFNAIRGWKYILSRVCKDDIPSLLVIQYMLNVYKPPEYEFQIYQENRKFYSKYKKIIDSAIKKYPNPFTLDLYCLNRLFVSKNQGCQFANSNLNYRTAGLRQFGELFPTVTKANYSIIIVKQMRYISLEEIRELQGFPKTYQYLTKQSFAQQLGNSINNKLLKVLMRSFINIIVQ